GRKPRQCRRRWRELVRQDARPQGGHRLTCAARRPCRSQRRPRQPGVCRSRVPSRDSPGCYVQLDGLLDAVEGDAERARVEREARNCQRRPAGVPGGDARGGAAAQAGPAGRGRAGGPAAQRRVRQSREENRRCRRSHVTQSLLLLSNQLAEPSSVEASSETANRLLRSSEQLTETGEELKSMTGHISTAKRLPSPDSRAGISPTRC
uniref:HTH myb-type domain-containing protein n=1 Tax=Macrostomum lignano TaxID=282301 RepID=A0A1I8FTY3_9PLAT